jgi:hypothetical protein
LALRVLRKLNQATLNDLHDPTGEYHEDGKGRGIPQDWLYLDKKARYFRQGFVANDTPRAGAITEAVMEGTESFAVWDDEQGLIRDSIPDLKTAEKIVGSAKLTFSYDIELPEEPSTDTSGAAAVAQ